MGNLFYENIFIDSFITDLKPSICLRRLVPVIKRIKLFFLKYGTPGLSYHGVMLYYDVLLTLCDVLLSLCGVLLSLCHVLLSFCDVLLS